MRRRLGAGSRGDDECSEQRELENSEAQRVAVHTQSSGLGEIEGRRGTQAM